MNKTILIAIVIVILALGGYLIWKKYANKSEKVITPSETSSSANDANYLTTSTTSSSEIENDSTKTFTNNDQGVTLTYPSDWQFVDLGGPKNVTDPLVRENIAFFHLPDETDYGSKASVKLIRFVLEDNIGINNQDDWYNYIKEKYDSFLANETLSANYEPISFEKNTDIDGKYTVEEKYIEDGSYTCKDIYLYNGSDFYQFVTKIKNTMTNTYQGFVDNIINSLKISHE